MSNLQALKHRSTSLGFFHKTDRKQSDKFRIPSALSLAKSQTNRLLDSEYLVKPKTVKRYRDIVNSKVEDPMLSKKLMLQLFNAKSQDLQIKKNMRHFQTFYRNILQSLTKRSLQISNQMLGHRSAQVIVALILQSKDRIDQIVLDYNAFGEEGLARLAAAIKQTEVVKLSLKNCKFSATSLTKFCSFLEGNKTLQSICLANELVNNLNKLGSKGLSALGIYIQSNPGLVVLDIGGCNIGSEGLEALCEGLLSKENGLKVLKVGSNQIRELRANSVVWLVESELDLLDLSSNILDNSSVRSIIKTCKSLAQDNRLRVKSLDLAQNRVGCSGWEKLLRVLESNKVLVTLVLSGNNLDKVDFYQLLNKNTTIQDLIMSDTGLGQASVERLCRAIMVKSVRLSTLDLSQNIIGSISIRALASTFSNNSESLKILLMRRCQIDDEGGATLATAFFQHRYIHTLDLSSNFLGKKSGSALTELANQNPGIVNLRLSNNLIDPSTISLITKLVQQNIAKIGKKQLQRLQAELNSYQHKSTESKVKLVEAKVSERQALQKEVQQLRQAMQEKSRAKQEFIRQEELLKQELEGKLEQHQRKFRGEKASLLTEIAYLDGEIRSLVSKVNLQGFRKTKG